MTHGISQGLVDNIASRACMQFAYAVQGNEGEPPLEPSHVLLERAQPVALVLLAIAVALAILGLMTSFPHPRSRA